MDRIKDLYIDQDYNCAETTLRFANEVCGLGLGDEEIKLVSGFGGGLCCEKTCGVLCASLAAIGRLCVEPRAHATEGFKELVSGFVAGFEERLGSSVCGELKEQYHKEDVRCIETVRIGTTFLEEYLKENEEKIVRK